MKLFPHLSVRRIASSLPILLFLVTANQHGAYAQSDQSYGTYTKIANFETDLPNWPPGEAKWYTMASISNDVVLFRCRMGGGGYPFFSVYTKPLDGGFTVQVDRTTTFPGSDGQTFLAANGLSLNNGIMTFFGYSYSLYATYKKPVASNDFEIVVNEQTDIPGGVGKFRSNHLGIPSINSGTIAFYGTNASGDPQRGIYAEVNDNLVAVADLNTEIPNHVGLSFGYFDGTPSSGGDYLVFLGYDDTYVSRGVYRYSVASHLIEVIADELTDFPNGTGKFANFCSNNRPPVIDGEECAFQGVEQGTDNMGIFIYRDDNIDLIAMKGDTIPGTINQVITEFGEVSIDEGDVVFVAAGGSHSRYSCILAKKGDNLTRVIDTNEILDGRTISSFSLSRQALSNDKVIFVVSFADATWGIYLATLDATPTEVPNPENSAAQFILHANVPNPFNPLTTISFDLLEREAINLRVFDVSGRLVRELVGGEVMEQGRHEVSWNGRDSLGRTCPSGTYFYRLQAGDYVETKRMTLLK